VISLLATQHCLAQEINAFNVYGITPLAHSANQANDVYQPNSLKPWLPWVENQIKDYNCPYDVQQNSVKKRCLWPGTLQLNITNTQGQFNYALQAYSDQLVILPGQLQNWPRNVQLDNKQVPVINTNGQPSLALLKGRHTITGQFKWQEPPNRLKLPANIGLIELINNDQPLLPRVENNWLKLKTQAQPLTTNQDNNHLSIRIFRLLEDTRPQKLTTYIQLDVSGAVREVKIPAISLDNTLTLNLISNLPARLNDQGDLIVEVKQGSFVVEYLSRFKQQYNKFAAPLRNTPKWGLSTEYWAFKNQPTLRQVSVKGQIVDAQQIKAPSQWRSLPFYRMQDAPLELRQLHQGEVLPKHNDLSLNKKLWLNFNADAYVAVDAIKGAMSRDWRLSAAQNIDLQRASVVTPNSQDPQHLLITQDQHKAQGVELRESNIDLTSIATIPLDQAGVHHELPLTGWQSPMNSLDIDLQVPPGWHLMAAQGADSNDTWLSQWHLWDVFLGLLIIALTHKLMNFKLAIAVAIVFILNYQTQLAPLGVMYSILASFSIVRFTKGKLQSLGVIVLLLSSLVFLVQFSAYSVEQLRYTLYPQLAVEQSFNSIAQPKDSIANQTPAGKAARESQLQSSRSSQVTNDIQADEISYSAMKSSLMMSSPQTLEAYNPAQQQASESNFIQAGIGQPQWQWRHYKLWRDGVVLPDERLHLWFLTPIAMKAWRILSLLSFVLLACGFIHYIIKNGGVNWRGLQLLTKNTNKAPSDLQGNTATTLSSIIGIFLVASIGLCTLVSPQKVLADTSESHQAAISDSAHFPPAYLLEQLQSQITQTPDCVPQCVFINQARVNLDNQQLIIDLQVSSLAPQGLALPSSDAWHITSVLMDEKQANNTLVAPFAMLIPPGQHRIRLVGQLLDNGEADFRLNIAQPIPQVDVQLNGWSSTHSSGSMARDQLVFTPELVTAKQDKSNQVNKLQAPAPAFVHIERSINLVGQQWQVETRLTRLAPARGKFAMTIDFIPGEQPLSELLNSEAIQFNQTTAQVTFGSNTRQLQWRSQLKPTANLQLSASESFDRVETWQVKPSFDWHFTFAKLQPVNSNSADRSSQKNSFTAAKTWQPWPGEAVNITASRPIATQGATQVIESGQLNVTPGDRLNTFDLTLQVLATQPGDYQFSVSDTAEIKQVRLDGNQVFNQGSSQLKVSLMNGQHRLKISWQELKHSTKDNHKANFFTQLGLQEFGLQELSSPKFTSSLPIANLKINLISPSKVWLMAISGPALGPAVIFWAVLIMIIVGAIGFTWLQKKWALNMPIGLIGWIVLGVGVSTVWHYAMIPIALWFFSLAVWSRFADQTIQAVQQTKLHLIFIVITLSSLWVLGFILVSIPLSLLNSPDMLIAGNNSTSNTMQWFQDFTYAGVQPQASLYYLPLWVYHLIMLIWSAWIAFRLVRWILWAFQNSGFQQYWHTIESNRAKKSKAQQD